MSEDKPRPPVDVNRLLLAVILLTIPIVIAVIVIAVIGYLVTDTIRAVTASRNASNTFGTQAAQILHPTPTLVADPVTIIKQVRSLSRLETASFTIEKVITADSGEGPFGFLFQDKLLLVAHGEVIAGVDLSRMDDNAVKVAGPSVFVTLPASEIFVATLDNDQTYVYDRQTGVLGQKKDLETLARQKAQEEILLAALNGGILTMAQDNAEEVVRKLLEALGFTDITFVHGTPAPGQNRGGTPQP